MINLEKLSGKQLAGMTFLHGFLYTLFTLIIPCIIITVKYDIFTSAEKGMRLTGIGVMILLAFLFIGLGKLKKQIEAIPIAAQGWKAKARALLMFIYNIILPIIILVLAYFVQENIIVALTVIRLSIISILVGSVENLILGSSVQRENAARNNASTMKEAKKREDKV